MAKNNNNSRPERTFCDGMEIETVLKKSIHIFTSCRIFMASLLTTIAATNE